MKIIHIFDDEKIVNDVINLYEKLGFNQNYVVLHSGTPKHTIGLKGSYLNIEFVNTSDGNWLSQLKLLVRDSRVVIFQALSYEKAKFLHNLKKNGIITIWVLWGYGLYNIKKFQENRWKFSMWGLSWIRQIYTYDIIYRQAVKKLDHCFFLLQKDFDILLKSLPCKALWTSIHYQTIDVLEKKQFKIDGPNILLGNSGTPENNHLVVFDSLKVNSKSKVITPLSYGDRTYIDKIITKGGKRYGELFKPLTSLMNPSDYHKLISSCSVVIMPHFRQQAFGTILIMLFGGAKVYLFKKNPLFDYFIEIGLVIHEINKELNKGLFIPLSDSEKRSNRDILSRQFSEKETLKKLKVAFDAVLG